jgi:hypothetical protein
MDDIGGTGKMPMLMLQKGLAGKPWGDDARVKLPRGD